MPLPAIPIKKGFLKSFIEVIIVQRKGINKSIKHCSHSASDNYFTT